MEIGPVQSDQILVWFSVLAVELMLGKPGHPKVNLVSEMCNAYEFDYHELRALHEPFPCRTTTVTNITIAAT